MKSVTNNYGGHAVTNKAKKIFFTAAGTMPLYMVPICFIAHRFNYSWLITFSEVMMLIWVFSITVIAIALLEFMSNLT